MSSKAQQIELDNALVAPENRCIIGKCNKRINPEMKPKEPTYQVVLDALALTTCYPTFLIIIEVPGQEFDEPTTEEEALSFIHELGHSGEIKYITDVIVDHLHQPWRTFASIINKYLCGKDLAYQIDNIDSKKQDKMFYPRLKKIIIHHFLTKDKSISIRNRMFMHTATDDIVLGTMRFISRHADTQVYGAKPPKSWKSQKKSKSAISYEESPSKKKYAKAKKVIAAKPKPPKKKAPVKADRGKGDGTDFESGVPDEQHLKTSDADEGTCTKPRVPDVPKYDSKIDKESWGDSEEEDDNDEDDTEDDEENDDSDANDDDDDIDDNDGNVDDDNDANDDDNQKDDDKNDDEEETDSDRTESDRIKICVLNQSTMEYYEKEE
ncbi:hypothetical protein Tco_0983817 [Tanacetum coccineum]